MIFSRLKLINKYTDLFSKHKLRLAVSVILLIISAFCIAYAPKLAGDTLNLFTVHANTHVWEISKNILLMIILYLAGHLLKLPADRLTIRIGEDITYNLRIQLYEKITTIALKAIKSKSSGNVMTGLNNDLMSVSNMIILHLFDYFSYAVTVIIGILLLVNENLTLSLIYIFGIIILTSVYAFIGIKVEPEYKEQQNKVGALGGYMGDGLTNHLVIQSYNSEDYIEENFKRINNEVKQSYFSSRVKTGINSVSTIVIINLGTIIIYILGVYFLINGEITIGTLLTVILYGKILISPLKILSNSLSSIETAFASLKRLDEVLSQDSVKMPGSQKVDDFECIEFKNVNNINLKVNPGDIIAITGKKYSGKTQLLEMILRINQPETGEILIDDLNINEIDIKSYRNLFGYVPKYRWIFDATIAENIGYGAEEYTLEDIKKVCELIGYDKIINSLPNKYNTKISNNISSGEKELICLGRAIIKKPRILLLDEVTVDISNVIQNRTVFITTENEEKIIKKSDKVIDLNSYTS